VHGTGVYSAGVGPNGPALERFLDIKKKKKKKNYSMLKGPIHLKSHSHTREKERGKIKFSKCPCGTKTMRIPSEITQPLFLLLCHSRCLHRFFSTIQRLNLCPFIEKTNWL
jgi:hypothetical protein